MDRQLSVPSRRVAADLAAAAVDRAWLPRHDPIAGAVIAIVVLTLPRRRNTAVRAAVVDQTPGQRRARPIRRRCLETVPVEVA